MSISTRYRPGDQDRLPGSIHDAEARGQSFGQVTNAYIRVLDRETSMEVARYDLSEDASTETAMVFGECIATEPSGSSAPSARATPLAYSASSRITASTFEATWSRSTPQASSRGVRRAPFILKTFGWSFVVTAVALVAALLLGGPQALFLVAILSILEISLSFDNAVVNATILKRMNAFCKKSSSRSAS